MLPMDVCEAASSPSVLSPRSVPITGPEDSPWPPGPVEHSFANDPNPPTHQAPELLLNAEETLALCLRDAVDSALADLAPLLTRRLSERLAAAAPGQGEVLLESREEFGRGEPSWSKIAAAGSWEGGGSTLSPDVNLRVLHARDLSATPTVHALERYLSEVFLATSGFGVGAGNMRAAGNCVRSVSSVSSASRGSSTEPVQGVGRPRLGGGFARADSGLSMASSRRRKPRVVALETTSEAPEAASFNRRSFCSRSSGSLGLHCVLPGLVRGEPELRAEPSASAASHASRASAESQGLEAPPAPAPKGRSPNSSDGDSDAKVDSVGTSFVRQSAPGAHERTLTVGQVMHGCVDDLACRVTFQRRRSVRRTRAFSGIPPSHSFSTVLSCLGIRRWDTDRCKKWSVVYLFAARTAVLAFSMCCIAHAFVDMLMPGQRRRNLPSHLPIPFGTLAGFICFWPPRRAMLLQDTFNLLAAAAQERGFARWHSRHARIPALIYSVLWLCCTAAACYDAYDDPAQTAELIVMSGILLSLCFVMACVCRVLSKSIDSFCCEAIGSLPVSEISHVWNLTQAVVRKASGAIEHSLLALGLVMAASLPLILSAIARSVRAGSFCPKAVRLQVVPLFVTSGVAYIIVLAATVSEKCSRVPALVNAVNFGPGSERTRQQAVDYIVSSGAGFYVFGIRISMAMVLKFAYGWSMVGVALWSTILSASD